MGIFTILKQLITILLFTAGFSLAVQAQGRPDRDAAARLVRFYPNPASEVVYFELPGGAEKNYTIQLYNFMGKKVRETNAAEGRNQVLLDGFYRGVYIYQLRDKSGRVVDSGRFQVVR